ncbi:cytochrome c oxidase assembly factor 4 homolog, mitochondrial isoform X2 [Brienomyrus brachyistius]|nr:cytochrome c oxidase assembly factor 4 homolog, mitochondrial isoform X2 [Brienomyrus brachyistius]XP_048838775.1 cytochrome c oxidase assembly factor 4 homolog, mitochondrial isoform X2 [Brienomyrus brachyistius]
MAVPTPPHNRLRPEDEDDPVDRMVNRTGCGDQHYAVQDCMAKHQDWRKCQPQVLSFKECMAAYQKARKGQLLNKGLIDTS